MVDLEVVDAATQPELVGFAKAMQAPITFIRDRKGRARFGAVAAASKRIYINVDAEEAPVALVMHEAVHTMPADIKETLISRVMDTVSPSQRATFLNDFRNYRSLEPAQQNEELVAMLTQEDAKRPEFWSRLADKLGEGDFKAVVQHIVRTIDSLLQGFTGESAGRYTQDLLKVREAISPEAGDMERHWHVGAHSPVRWVRDMFPGYQGAFIRAARDAAVYERELVVGR